MAAPSLNMKPSRVASKGREAVCGLSLRVERALTALNPAMPMGLMEDSVPPANMTGTSPRRIISKAVPTASAPEEQADMVQKLGPLSPSMMDTCAAAISAIIMGTVNGLSLSGPFSMRTLACSKRVLRPPTPLPTITPMLSAFEALTASPDCASACLAATTASCAKRSMRLASLMPMEEVGSKPLISPAILVS